MQQTEEEESDVTNKLTSQLKLLSRKRYQKKQIQSLEKTDTTKLDAKKALEEKRALSRMYQKKFIERRERQAQIINR